MKTFYTLLLVFVGVIALAVPAMAQNDASYDTIIRPPAGTYQQSKTGGTLIGVADGANVSVTDGATNILQYWKDSFKTIAYILSGVGVFALAIMAFFGKFQWKWLLMLTFGLFFIGTFEFLSGTTGSTQDGWLMLDNQDDWTGNAAGDKAGSHHAGRVWSEAIWRAAYVAEQFETFTYTMSGLGVFALALGAFMGRFQWKWFFMISGMLLMISGFQYWISYLHDSEARANSFDLANNRVQDFYGYAETFVYVASGIAMLAMVIMAFLGKFQWKWLVTMAGALLLIAGFQYLVVFLS